MALLPMFRFASVRLFSGVLLICLIAEHHISSIFFFFVTNRYYCLRPPRSFMQTAHDENHATFERESRLSFPHTFRSSTSPDDFPVAIFHFQMFAAEGLRTLVVAYKDISMDMYTEWEAKYKAAR